MREKKKIGILLVSSALVVSFACSQKVEASEEGSQSLANVQTSESDKVNKARNSEENKNANEEIEKKMRQLNQQF
ncbi:hypothetical protein D3H64_07005 [Atopobacter sp. AH10]|uniref:hypothetical protein n=1 Tax=Atopobacter sp. AH10 TaxID=2315861 RepID=UPI000EF208E0|nr:hypothetical protein [Atopobacter sp. AH10]RLK62963.1 hypothetical protein D3H64_07005 [Atopobacter sp. AH10]